jgi:hypothetical protein
MRHALEAQNLQVDWEVSESPTCSIWTGVENQKTHYEVVKSEQNNQKWMVETRRGATRKNLRRIGKLCFSDLRKQDADKRARRILQNLVLGKI